MFLGDAVETVLHVAACDDVERPAEPVCERPLEAIAVVLVGARLPLGIGLHVLLEGLPEKRHAPAPGAIRRRVLADCDHAEQPVGLATRLLGRHPVAASDDEALVGRGSASRTGSVVDDVGLDTGGVDLDAEACELVVPRDPRFLGRLEAVDGALCDCELDARDVGGRLGATRRAALSGPQCASRRLPDIPASRCAPFLLCRPDSSAQTMTVVRSAGQWSEALAAILVAPHICIGHTASAANTTAKYGLVLFIFLICST